MGLRKTNKKKTQLQLQIRLVSFIFFIFIYFKQRDFIKEELEIGDAETLVTERQERSGEASNLYIIFRVYRFI